MPATAIFDLDRTITKEPTWTRFLLFVNGGRPDFWLSAPALLGQAIAYKTGFADRDSVKKRGLRTLSHLTKADFNAAADAFIAREVADGLRPGAVAAIQWHAQRSDRLVIATAAIAPIAEALGRALGFNDVIATQLDWAPGAPPAPRLAGANCYGAEKRRRLEAAGLCDCDFFYSDHISDLDILLRAKHGIAVNPSSHLRTVAPARGLTIADFDSTDIHFLKEKANGAL